MKIFCLAIAIVLCSAFPALAETKDNFDDSGNAFVRHCSASNKSDPTASEWSWVMACTGYVEGMVEGFDFGSSYVEGVAHEKVRHAFCLPMTVEHAQNVKIILKYILDNPSKAHLPTGVLIIEAMEKAFPCSTK